MRITTFKNDPTVVAELVDLILYCQNTEAKLGITMLNSQMCSPFPITIRLLAGNFG